MMMSPAVLIVILLLFGSVKDSAAECKNKNETNCSSLCSFEDESAKDDGMCGWKNDKGNDLQWSVHHGLPLSNVTGPTYDHTLKNPKGHYLYVDAKQNSSVYNPKGRFVSATYNYTYTAYNCIFSLWYNMYHKNVFDNCDVMLSIYYSKWYDKTLTTTRLWRNETTTNTQWKSVLLQLPRCPHNFSIVIETEQYWKSKTDLAIDDLKFNCTEQPPRQCDPTTEFQCIATQQCVPLDSLCDIDRNCCDGSDESEEICAGYTKMDFENGIDEKEGWKQLQNDKYDNFDFLVQNGKADPLVHWSTGPQWDHTFEDDHGKYIYIDASARVENQIAAIRSPTIKATNSSSKICTVQFWYNMYGRDIGSLGVYISVYYGKPRGGKPVWSLSGNQGKEWKKGSVQLDSEKDFQLIFNASVGSGLAGDVAIDDISFTPGCVIAIEESISGQPTKPPPTKCEHETQFSCRSTNTCIPRFYKCDFHQDCPGGEDESEEECGYPQGFENGLQPWMYPLKSIPWYSSASFEIGKDVWQSAGNVATTDASKNYGSYIYFDAKKIGRRIAVIDSPWYHNSYANCKMSLWYHMNVPSRFLLKVVLISVRDGQEENWYTYGTPLLGLSGNMGTEWREINITIGRRREKFKIRILAKGHGNVGVIAISSVNFFDCDMTSDICPKFIPKNQFKCNNGRCIPKSRVCDFVDDCGDLSDEDSQHQCYNYTGCNFEQNSQCHFIQDNTTDDFDWSLKKGSTDSLNTGPEHDHTLRTKDGRYMYIEASAEAQASKPAGSKARLRSFPLTNKGGCKVAFYYHMYGEGVGQLNINVLFKNGTRSLLKMFKDESKFLWREGVVDLSNATTNTSFQVEFEGVIGSSFHSDIAIDDIIFNPQCGKTGHYIFPNINPCPGKFWCTANGNCAPKGSKCNNIDDCKDKSDEFGCHYPPKPTPKKREVDPQYVAVVALSGVSALLLLATIAIIVVTRKRKYKMFK